MTEQHYTAINNPPEDEISLVQILGFFRAHWQKIFITMILGALLGLVGGVVLGKYKAQVVIVNNGYTLDFLTWSSLERQFPSLVSQFAADEKVNPKYVKLYEAMKDPKWWAKNVTVTYALSKSDMKEFAVISKDLEEHNAQTILNLVVNSSAKDRLSAQENVNEVAHFLRNGSMYLELNALLDRYSVEVDTKSADIAKRMAELDLQRKYLLTQEQNLQSLISRFPKRQQAVDSKVIDFKDSNAKYMPLDTQMIAVDVEINHVNEQVKELQDQLMQVDLMRRFVEQAVKVLKKENNGVAVAEQLIHIVDQLRTQAGAGNLNAEALLSRVRSDVTRIDTLYEKGLKISPTSMVKTSLLLPVVLGALLGGILMVLYQLLLAALRVEKESV